MPDRGLAGVLPFPSNARCATNPPPGIEILKKTTIEYFPHAPRLLPIIWLLGGLDASFANYCHPPYYDSYYTFKRSNWSYHKGCTH